MDKINLKEDDANIIFKWLESNFSDISYISLFNRNNNDFLFVYNNNYNGWGDEYYSKKYYEDCPLLKTAIGMAYTKKESFIVWNDIIQFEDRSYKIEKQRNSFGVYNGMSLLLNHHNNIIILSLCSKENIDPFVFLQSILSSKNDIMNMLKRKLNI